MEFARRAGWRDSTNISKIERAVRPASAEHVQEAAAGTYEAGRLGHGPADSTEVLQVAKHTALHLEMRDTYDPSHPAFQDFVSGGSGSYEMTNWRKIVQDAVERGVTIRRARVVSEPLSDYIRWEHMLTSQNVAAGEDVRCLAAFERVWERAIPHEQYEFPSRD
ncbi:DUF6879 family protein [Actinomadura darangshiensis]|uniref:DUF6879 family protein n=1 Tax=Actinomadura darangshiensis TaxID=705336 RepID=UPI001FB70254|nr:DUF6879 family protein [Actinomadura darangshiensis]